MQPLPENENPTPKLSQPGIATLLMHMMAQGAQMENALQQETGRPRSVSADGLTITQTEPNGETWRYTLPAFNASKHLGQAPQP